MDGQKKKLCEENGVRLIEWAYDIPPEEDTIERELSKDNEVKEKSIMQSAAEVMAYGTAVKYK